MAKNRFDINQVLACDDPREMPIYGISEVAHYLMIPGTTLRTWVRGRSYPAGDGKKRFQPVIHLPRHDLDLLSFYNLVEAHILRALRTEHRIKLKHIRSALSYVSKEFGKRRPLIEQQFETDGVGLLVERLGRLIDASAQGQIVMRKVVEAHLERLDWEDNVVSRLYPFTRTSGIDSPRSVLIDPRVSFGRPVLGTCRVETAVIAERYKAGDSIDSLADDYACERSEIEEGLRCELALQHAA